jgi:hypothetical protein
MKPVAAAARRDRDLADANCIERTTCEGRVLLLTTEAMDFWLRVDRDSATHAVYWPAALLPIIIGPFIFNGVQLRANPEPPSHITSHISHLTSHISHLTSHISHLTSHISPSHISHLTHLTSHMRISKLYLTQTCLQLTLAPGSHTAQTSCCRPG